MVFYPVDGVSRMQKLQMTTTLGGNVYVAAVDGNFDDAQNGVKAIFGDASLAEKANENGFFFSSANSINWGRLAPQVVYYISAYCDLLKEGVLKSGEILNFTVPTGNFGNIFAGYIAKLMGLPIGKMVCASNKNNVLTDFFEKGVYNRNRKFYPTMSPSMDILISSNLERLLYVTFGAEKCAEYMVRLQSEGKYTLGKKELKRVNESFVGYYTDEDDCSDCIKRTYENTKQLIDTHTAVALCAAERYMSDAKSKTPMLVVSTASPYKFAADVYSSLGEGKPESDLEAPEMLEKLTGVNMPEPLRRVLSREPIHLNVIRKEDMPASVLEFAFK